MVTIKNKIATRTIKYSIGESEIIPMPTPRAILRSVKSFMVPCHKPTQIYKVCLRKMILHAINTPASKYYITWDIATRRVSSLYANCPITYIQTEFKVSIVTASLLLFENLIKIRKVNTIFSIIPFTPLSNCCKQITKAFRKTSSISLQRISPIAFYTPRSIVGKIRVLFMLNSKIIQRENSMASNTSLCFKSKVATFIMSFLFANRALAMLYIDIHSPTLAQYTKGVKPDSSPALKCGVFSGKFIKGIC